MEQNLQSMGCGGCGNFTFRMYKNAKGLYTECTQCKSVSTLTVSTPKIDIGWAEGNDNGILAQMDDKN